MLKPKYHLDCYKNMQEYEYRLTNEDGTKQDIIITAPADDSGQYAVMLDGSRLGYVFVDGFDDEHHPLWKGSNTILDLIAPKIGEHIEQFNK